MLLFLSFSIFIGCILGFSNITIEYGTTLYKDSKIYAYEPLNSDLKWSGVNIYHLKDGLISDIKIDTVNFTNITPSYTPQLLHLPAGLSNERSDQIWMLGGMMPQYVTSADIDQEHWNCQIVNDSELNLVSSFIKIPEYKNFPLSGYSQIIINTNNNPVLYIIGGVIYSPEIKDQQLTNYFFKYEFKSETWSDLSESTKNILPPIAFHKTIEIDNMLVILGGVTLKNTFGGDFTEIVAHAKELNYIDLNQSFKYDLSTQKWSSIQLKVNKDPESYKRGSAIGPSLDIYNGKIITYANIFNFKKRYYEPQLGILDQKTWEWEWFNASNEAGSENTLRLMFHQTVVIDDQLILIHGNSNQNQKKIYAIDLKTNKFKNSLKLPIINNDTEPQDSNNNNNTGLPMYSIIIIVVVSITAVIFIVVTIWLYFKYRYRANTEDKSKQNMIEVWADLSNNNNWFSSDNSVLIFGSTISSNGLTISSINEEANFVKYKLFEHEIDLQDMDESKTLAKFYHYNSTK